MQTKHDFVFVKNLLVRSFVKNWGCHRITGSDRLVEQMLNYATNPTQILVKLKTWKCCKQELKCQPDQKLQKMSENSH